MERIIKYAIIVVLTTPLWLFMYKALVPDVVNKTETVFIEKLIPAEIDCAECIKLCQGTTYKDNTDESSEVIVPVIDPDAPTMTEVEQMKIDHPDLWKDMGPKYFSVVDDDGGATSFSDAFRMARAELGPGQTFNWNNDLYTTDYKEEVELSVNPE